MMSNIVTCDLCGATIPRMEYNGYYCSSNKCYKVDISETSDVDGSMPFHPEYTTHIDICKHCMSVIIRQSKKEANKDTDKKKRWWQCE